MSTTAPPVNQRPRCHHCNKPLPPNYRWQEWTSREPIRYRKAFRVDGRDAEDMHDSQLDEKTGRWFVMVPVFARRPQVWDGTYGRRRDGLFCGTNCGYAWAARHAE